MLRVRAAEVSTAFISTQPFNWTPCRYSIHMDRKYFPCGKYTEIIKARDAISAALVWCLYCLFWRIVLGQSCHLQLNISSFFFPFKGMRTEINIISYSHRCFLLVFASTYIIFIGPLGFSLRYLQTFWDFHFSCKFSFREQEACSVQNGSNWVFAFKTGFQHHQFVSSTATFFLDIFILGLFYIRTMEFVWLNLMSCYWFNSMLVLNLLCF